MCCIHLRPYILLFLDWLLELLTAVEQVYCNRLFNQTTRAKGEAGEMKKKVSGSSEDNEGERTQCEVLRCFSACLVFVNYFFFFTQSTRWFVNTAQGHIA